MVNAFTPPHDELDPGAPQDLPAWRRLTGETLLHHDAQRRHYYIRRATR
jgi:hypothetical protein